MGDTVLRLRIGVDGSNLIPDTMQNASVAVRRHTETINTHFREAGEAGRQMGTDINWGIAKVAPAVQDAEYSIVNAKEAVRGLGEQIGVHMPKMVSNFIAEVPAIGSALSAAFSAVAVVGLIQVLMQLPEVFEKISAAVTGWDEEAKKAYEHQIDLNKKYIDQLKETQREQRALTLIGKTGSDEKRTALSIERDELKRNQQELHDGQVRVAADMQKLAELEEKSGFHLRDLLNPGMRLFANHAAGTADEIERLKKSIEATTAANIELDLSIKKSQNITQPKQGAEAAAEEKKEAQKAADDKLAIERAYRLAQAEIYAEHVAAAKKQVDDELKVEAAFRAATAEVALKNQMELLASIQAANKAADDEAKRQNDEFNRDMLKIRNDQIQEGMARGEQARRDELRKIQEFTQAQAAEMRKQAALLKEIDTNFNSHVMKWVQGQQTIKQSLEDSWNAIASNAISNMLKMAEQELISHLMHKTMAKEGVLVDAKASAASAYKNVMKALPFPADVIVAPIAAAGAFAAVAAFGSFDRGGIVPNTGMHMLHKKEMVLDPMLSSGIQQMIMGGGARQPARGGDVVLHYNAQGAGNRDDHKRNAAEIVKIIKREQRRGALPSQ